MLILLGGNRVCFGLEVICVCSLPGEPLLWEVCLVLLRITQTLVCKLHIPIMMFRLHYLQHLARHLIAQPKCLLISELCISQGIPREKLRGGRSFSRRSSVLGLPVNNLSHNLDFWYILTVAVQSRSLASFHVLSCPDARQHHVVYITIFFSILYLGFDTSIIPQVISKWSTVKFEKLKTPWPVTMNRIIAHFDGEKPVALPIIIHTIHGWTVPDEGVDTLESLNVWHFVRGLFSVYQHSRPGSGIQCMSCFSCKYTS